MSSKEDSTNYDGKHMLQKGKKKVQGEPQSQKGKRQVQGEPQSQAAALHRHQGEEKKTKPNKRKSNKRTKSTWNGSLFPKRGNRNAKRIEKHNNKITEGKTKVNRLVE